MVKIDFMQTVQCHRRGASAALVSNRLSNIVFHGHFIFKFFRPVSLCPTVSHVRSCQERVGRCGLLLLLVDVRLVGFATCSL